MLSWTKQLFTRPMRSSVKPAGRPDARKFRPVIEELESRVTPSAPGITVNLTNNFTLNSGQYGAWVAGTANPSISSTNPAANTNVLDVLDPTTGTFSPAEWTIQSATVSGSTVTITTVSPHALQSGDQVLISGVADQGYNGVFSVLPTGLTSTTFEYTDTNTIAGSSSGGTASDSTLIISSSIGAAPGGATSSGSIVTITTTSPHQLITGSTALISGFTGDAAAFNGSYIVTVTSPTTFYYSDSNVSAIPINGGPPTNPPGASDSTAGGVNTVTITTQKAHGLHAGDWVTISGVGPGGSSAYNGTFQVLSSGLTTNSFEYNLPSSTPLQATTGGGNVQLDGGGGTVTGLGVPVIPLSSLPSFSMLDSNGNLVGGILDVFVSTLTTPPARLPTGFNQGTSAVAPNTPPFTSGTYAYPPFDIMEFAFIAGSNSTFDVSAVSGFGMPLTLQATTVTSGPSTVGVTQSGLSFNRAAIASAYTAFMNTSNGGDPQGADYAELLYNSKVPVSSGSTYAAPPKVSGQFYEIVNPTYWLKNQSSSTAANDPLATYWDSTLTKFFQNGNYLSINIGTSTYSGSCSGGTYTLTNGSGAQVTITNPGTGLAGAEWVFGQANIPNNDTGTVEDQILEAFCRGVALDGVFTSSKTSGESTTAWNANANGTTSGVQTFQWYTQHTPPAFAGFTSVYDTYAKFLHYSDLSGKDSRFISGDTPIFVGNAAYGFSEDENPAGPYSGGEVPSKMDGTVPDNQTLTLTIDPWQSGSPTDSNTAYVNSLYQLLLNRPADSAAAGWVNLLNGNTPYATVVQEIEQSQEYLSDLVAGLYQHYLNRAPDSSAQGWVTALQNGSTVEQVIDGIVGSPEFFSVEGHDTNGGYLDALYNDVLGRAADTVGYNGWLSAMTGGTSSATVALAFLSSTEYRQNLIAGVGWSPGSPTASPPSSYFQGYYLTYLLRQGDPAGVSGWLTDLQNGVPDQQVLAAILGSAEGYAAWS